MSDPIFDPERRQRPRPLEQLDLFFSESARPVGSVEDPDKFQEEMRRGLDAIYWRTMNEGYGGPDYEVLIDRSQERKDGSK